MFQPRVADLSHHNGVRDLHAAAAAGLWGIIHKATQGVSYRDDRYEERRPMVADADMEWGAYHFGDSSDPVAQVRFFLDFAKPDEHTMLCLDYEDHPRGRQQTMRPEQMVAFLREILRRTGKKAVLYGGNRIKEDMGRLSQEDQDFVSSHLLWLCQYGPRPTLPPHFTRSFLWQYTDGRVGPEPHGIEGITGQVDLNLFNGTREDLQAAWRAVADAPQPADATDKPARGSDDAGPQRLPPFLSRRPSAKSGGLNVRPQSARYDVRVEIVQRHLDAMGYHEVGDVDGRWGGKTAAAIAAFLNDRGVQAPAVMGDRLNDEISDATDEGWSRPIADTRANAKPHDLAPRNVAVKMSLWQRLCARVAAVGAGAGIVGTGPLQMFDVTKDKLAQAQAAFGSVPAWVWFTAALIVAGAVWYASDRAAKATTRDFNEGRLNQ